MRFLERILRWRVPDIEERLEKAAYQANNGGTMSDVDTIVDDFFFLIKKMYRKRGIKKLPVVEFREGSMWPVVDGEKMDFDEIPHNDAKGTEAKMEIGVLYEPEMMREIVEEKLRAKIAQEW